MDNLTMGTTKLIIVVEMLIEKYKDKKMDNLNQIEQLADEVLQTLAIAGLKYYNELKGEFDENRN